MYHVKITIFGYTYIDNSTMIANNLTIIGREKNNTKWKY